MSDNELRNRIKAVLNDHRIEATGPGEVSCRCEHEWRPTYSYRNHLAQAIIDDLGLTVDSHFEHKAGSAIELNETQAEYDERVKPRTFHRVVGGVGREMNWADEANAKANTQWHNPNYGHGDCMKCRINFQVREGFELGAKWQRDQLRADEAVELMAVVIYNLEDPVANAGWEFESEDLKDTFRAWAKEQITALLGEES